MKIKIISPDPIPLEDFLNDIFKKTQTLMRWKVNEGYGLVPYYFGITTGIFSKHKVARVVGRTVQLLDRKYYADFETAIKLYEEITNLEVSLFMYGEKQCVEKEQNKSEE